MQVVHSRHRHDSMRPRAWNPNSRLMALILAFYSKNDDASEAVFQNLKAKQFLRTAVIKLCDGQLSIVESRAAQLLGAVASLGLLLSVGVLWKLSVSVVLL